MLYIYVYIYYIYIYIRDLDVMDSGDGMPGLCFLQGWRPMDLTAGRNMRDLCSIEAVQRIRPHGGFQNIGVPFW